MTEPETKEDLKLRAAEEKQRAAEEKRLAAEGISLTLRAKTCKL